MTTSNRVLVALDLEAAFQNVSRRFSIIPTLMATTQSPDTDFLFNATPRLGAQLAQLQTTCSLQKNKPAFQLTPLGAALRCFRVSVARRLMLPHPAAPNATDVVQSCANRAQRA